MAAVRVPELSTTTERPYHHGRLAEALIDAAVDLARVGGPDAVVLREAARRVGVSPTAAYRHFDGQNALLSEVKVRALQALADRMAAAISGVPAQSDARLEAVAKFVAIGRSYLEFAQLEKGLFKSFCLGLPMTADMKLDGDVPAFGLLSAIADEMVATGAMAAERRPGAEIAAWAAVHGLAVLMLDGVLQNQPGIDSTGMAEATLNLVLHGLLLH